MGLAICMLAMMLIHCDRSADMTACRSLKSVDNSTDSCAHNKDQVRLNIIFAEALQATRNMAVHHEAKVNKHNMLSAPRQAGIGGHLLLETAGKVPKMVFQRHKPPLQA